VASGWSALRLVPGARRNAAPVTGLTSVNEFARVVVFWMKVTEVGENDGHCLPV
jgi:hypothetical protein